MLNNEISILFTVKSSLTNLNLNDGFLSQKNHVIFIKIL